MKRHKIAITSIFVALAVLCGAFFIYVSDYYRTEDTALAVMTGGGVRTVGNLTIIEPSYETDTALIFYPGGKVEATAYLPILEKIKQNGITCVLVKMPFNLAVFSPNAADKVFDQLSEINNWYIGGHSLGGAMASDYAAKNPEKIKGLVLLGAYIYGDYPPQDALTVYGSFDSDLKANINYTENIVLIEGGNHAQFGNYGKQKGDHDATITAAQQQDETVAAITGFVITKNAAPTNTITTTKHKWTEEEIAEYRKTHSGVLYSNNKDSNLFVPKASGFGTTLNWANLLSWLFGVLLAVLIVMAGIIKVKRK